MYNKRFTKELVIGIVILILIANQFASGQPPQHLKINLQQALELAKQNYPSIKAKQAEVQGAGYGIKESRTEYIPKLINQTQGLYATSNGLRGAFFPAEGTAIPVSGGIKSDFSDQAAFGSFSTLLVDWNFFSFGRIRANVASSRADKARADADYENEIFQHQIQVIDAYLLLLVYEKLENVQKNNLGRAGVVQKVIQASTQSGLRPGVDSSYTNAEFAKAEIILLESQRNEKASVLSSQNLSAVVMMRLKSIHWVSTRPFLQILKSHKANSLIILF